MGESTRISERVLARPADPPRPHPAHTRLGFALVVNSSTNWRFWWSLRELYDLPTL